MRRHTAFVLGLAAQLLSVKVLTMHQDDPVMFAVALLLSAAAVTGSWVLLLRSVK